MRALVLAAVVAALPPACTKLLGQKGAPSATQDPGPAPIPTPVPLTSATTPPVYLPPDPGTATVAPSGTTPPANPDLAAAKAAADAKPPNWKKVKSLLEKKTKSGKASSDERDLLSQACTALKDKACLEVVKKAADDRP